MSSTSKSNDRLCPELIINVCKTKFMDSLSVPLPCYRFFLLSLASRLYFQLFPRKLDIFSNLQRQTARRVTRHFILWLGNSNSRLFEIDYSVWVKKEQTHCWVKYSFRPSSPTQTILRWKTVLFKPASLVFDSLQDPCLTILCMTYHSAFGGCFIQSHRF